MYKKIIAFLLIFIILFNFIIIEKVKAEAITLTTAGLIFFAMAITALGVSLVNSDDFRVLYDDFINTLEDNVSHYASLAYEAIKSLITSGKFYLGMAIEYIKVFIEEMGFLPGENTLLLGEGAIEYNYYREITIGYGGSAFEVDFPGEPGVYKYDITIFNADGDFNLGLLEIILNIIPRTIYVYDLDVSEKLLCIDIYDSRIIFRGNELETTYESIEELRIIRLLSMYDYYRVLERASDVYCYDTDKFSFSYNLNTFRFNVIGQATSDGDTWDYDSSIFSIDISEILGYPEIEVPQPQAIPYRGYGGVLEGEEYPDVPVPVPVPVPTLDFPNVVENPSSAGGVIYPGTPGNFVFDMDNKYVDDWLKRIAGKQGVGSIPGVYPNVGEGSIDFPQEVVDNPAWDIPIDSPWDIPIDVPADVPVPTDIPTGLGVIGWLLKYIAQGITGIWNFLSNLFSEPTKTLNFDSLLSLDFKEKFPFCLPWDLYNSVSLIAQPASVPKFQVNIKSAQIDIDFETFEPLASISRIFFTLIYSISLIMISRRLIGGE